MSPQDKHALRGFAWQAALIVVPMIALAVMGLTLLRKDRALVEQEARERAAAFANASADDLAEALSRDLDIALRIAPADSSTARSPDSVPTNGVVKVMIDPSGRPIHPPPIEPIPTPSPFPVHELTSDQRVLWEAAQRAEFIEHNHTNGLSAMEALLQSEPSERLDAIIRFNLGVHFARANQTDDAHRFLGDCAKLEFSVRAESGVPIRTLANLKLLDLTLTNAIDDQADRRIWLSSVCREAVEKPTMLSPLILSKARLLQTGRTIERNAISPSVWQSSWEADERARAMLEAAKKQGAIAACLAAANAPQRPPSPSTWFRMDADEWLAEVATNGPPLIIIFRSASQLQALAGDALRRQRFDPHTTAVVQLGSRAISSMQTVSKPAKDLANVIRRLVSGSELAVAVRLVDPDALFAQQRWRTRWFGLLIVAAFAVTLIGLALSWRAFRRQLRLSEMKSNFVSSVSHELRAPVASVRLMAEGLESGRIHDEPKRRDYFRFIVQECRRLTGLIENVLDFARIEQGRKHYEFEETDIAALVRQTVKLMEPYAIDKRIALVIDAFPLSETLHAVVDPRAIQQALVNLIDNAIKHSPPVETVVIGADFSHSPSPGRDQQTQHLHLWVEDRGAGIPAAEHERIFERFYRRGSELRRETQGVGIGLSIVKHIVEAHAGRVIVRSTPGSGSRFTIELSMHNGVAMAPAVNERAVSAPTEL